MPEWVLGGGTALMLHTGHRLSKDIDAFIDDPQYLGFLSPEMGAEGVWKCETFFQTAKHLRLVYPEGEIDFIVASAVTELKPELRSIGAADRTSSGFAIDIPVEHPVEIALKKLFYRGETLKVRDVFDIAVVDEGHRDLLLNNLHHVSHLKQAILSRLSHISDDFCRQELAELDIMKAWKPVADTCLKVVREIAANIPDCSCTP